AEHSSVPTPAQCSETDASAPEKQPDLQGFDLHPQSSPHLGKTCPRETSSPAARALSAPRICGQPTFPGCVYTGHSAAAPDSLFLSPTSPHCDETDLPAQRSPPEAEARLPCPDVDACGPVDPQA